MTCCILVAQWVLILCRLWIFELLAAYGHAMARSMFEMLENYGKLTLFYQNLLALSIVGLKIRTLGDSIVTTKWIIHHKLSIYGFV